MPQKIRALKARLEKAGIIQRAGKSRHTKWLRPRYPGRAVLSGKDGSDAKPFQEKKVLDEIASSFSQKEMNREQSSLFDRERMV
ncbi:MAG: type II toxin-antitoxin system HicA family toxin [Cyanobacteria bacterium P01_F01_bin.33]